MDLIQEIDFFKDLKNKLISKPRFCYNLYEVTNVLNKINELHDRIKEIENTINFEDEIKLIKSKLSDELDTPRL